MHNPRVSGSRVAALFDEHRYWTKRMLWEYCANGRRPDDFDSARARSGRTLEQAILEMAAEDLGCEVIYLPQERDAYLHHSTLPLGALADGLVVHPERGYGIISAKAVSFTAWSRSWKTMKHGVPRDYELQLQAELMVWQTADLEGHPDIPDLRLGNRPTWGCVAAMNDLDLHLFERQKNDEMCNLMADKRRKFFASIEANNPPAWDRVQEEKPVIEQVYPMLDESFSVIDLEDNEAGAFDEAAELYLDAARRKKAADKDLDSAKIQMRALGGGHQMARGLSYQCKMSEVHRKARQCPHCDGEIAAAYQYVLYAAKEI